VVFDHATPGDLAAALDAQLGTASRSAAEPAPAGSLSLRQFYSEALARGEFGKGTDLLELVGSMRPQFGPDDVDPAIITRLSRGEEPVLYCFNSCMATAGTHSYARFAAALNGRREVNAVALPGFAEGERLPSVMAAAVAAQVAAVRAHAGERSVVLLGTSAGGWFAHAAAVELERQGVRVAGSALVDCYLPTSNFLDSFGLSLVGAMTEREASFAQGDDTRLVASGWYTRLFGAFEPEAVHHPQLLLRATKPLGRDVQGDGWRSTWPLPHDSVDVEGNHFSIMEDNCSSTVEVLESWIQRLC
jgi:thioesterase domain-containing protein